MLTELHCGLHNGSVWAPESQSLLQRDAMTIDERDLHVKQLHALDEDRLLERARHRFLNEIGTVQFPQIIVDIDKEIRFSGLLLQRAPRHTQELLLVYGALLAGGTARSVSEVSLMMPGVSMDANSDAQLVLERGNVLRAASDAVVELPFRQLIKNSLTALFV